MWNDHIATVQRKPLPVVICKYKLSVDKPVDQFLRSPVKLQRRRLLIQGKFRIHIFFRFSASVSVYICSGYHCLHSLSAFCGHIFRIIPGHYSQCKIGLSTQKFTVICIFYSAKQPVLIISEPKHKILTAKRPVRSYNKLSAVSLDHRTFAMSRIRTLFKLQHQRWTLHTIECIAKETHPAHICRFGYDLPDRLMIMYI